MAKTAYINTRIEPALKAKAEVVFKGLGVSMSEAVSMFLTQTVHYNGFPFPVRIPNAETIEAFNEDRKGLKSYTSAAEMMDDILSEQD